MIRHAEITDDDLKRELKQRNIRFGGNEKLKIYGLLTCKSGQRMKRENRVFFSTETEAIDHQFRPCGYCIPVAYKNWTNGLVSSND